MFASRFMPCTECGASVERSESLAHRCDPERLLDYEMFGRREEIASFDHGLLHHLESAAGRFETWLAARVVRGH